MQIIIKALKKIILFLKAIILSIIYFFTSSSNNLEKKQEKNTMKQPFLLKNNKRKDIKEEIDTTTKKSFANDLLKKEIKVEELLEQVLESLEIEKVKYPKKLEKIKNKLKKEITKETMKKKEVLEEKIKEVVKKEFPKEETIHPKKVLIKETKERKSEEKLEQAKNIPEEKENSRKTDEEKILVAKKETIFLKPLKENIIPLKKIEEPKEKQILPKENIDSKTKLAIFPEENKKEKQKTIEEKIKEIKTEEKNIEKIERQTKELEKNVLEELSKKDSLEINYDFIEEEIKKQKEQINILLKKNLSPKEKETLEKDKDKITILETKIKEKKYHDFKEITKPLEDAIALEELELLKERLKNLEISSLLEIESLLNNKQIGKKEKRNLEKVLIKEKMKSSCKFNMASMILGLPLIKNKYFLNLVSGLFLFHQFKFIKRILLKNENKEEQENLLNIKKGVDAFYESGLITHNNILEFEELKEIIFLKYPELKMDEEFMIYLKKVEKNLYKSYRSILKENKKLSKFLKKESVKKLERRKFYEFN